MNVLKVSRCCCLVSPAYDQEIIFTLPAPGGTYTRTRAGCAATAKSHFALLLKRRKRTLFRALTVVVSHLFLRHLLKRLLKTPRNHLAFCSRYLPFESSKTHEITHGSRSAWVLPQHGSRRLRSAPCSKSDQSVRHQLLGDQSLNQRLQGNLANGTSWKPACFYFKGEFSAISASALANIL